MLVNKCFLLFGFSPRIDFKPNVKPTQPSFKSQQQQQQLQQDLQQLNNGKVFDLWKHIS